MFKKLVKAAVPLVIVVVAVLVARGMIGSREQLKAGGEQRILPTVQTLAVRLGDVPIALESHGNVTANVELDMASEVTGRVIWVAPNFEPGVRFSADEVLLRIDPVNYELALAEAEASLASAKTALADAKALRQRASINEAQLNIKAVQHRITKAKQDLAYTEVRAPFDAIVDKQLVEIGQFVTTGQGVARLLSTDAAHISLPFTAAQAGFLGEPADVQAIVTSTLGEERREWRAKLLRVEERVDEQARIVPVVIQVDAPYDLTLHDAPLPLGLFVEASVSGRPISSAVRLPNSVLQQGDSIYVVKDNELRRREVSIIHRQGNDVVVNGGLENGDHVVLTRLDVMFEGLKVQTLNAQKTDQATANNDA
ncbi:MAG: efflux RND transporter periplasmic adaptor subunit [Halioglobus sp.]